MRKVFSPVPLGLLTEKREQRTIFSPHLAGVLKRKDLLLRWKKNKWDLKVKKSFL